VKRGAARRNVQCACVPTSNGESTSSSKPSARNQPGRPGSGASAVSMRQRAPSRLARPVPPPRGKVTPTSHGRSISPSTKKNRLLPFQ